MAKFERIEAMPERFKVSNKRRGTLYLFYRIARRGTIYCLAPLYYVNNTIIFRYFDFLGQKYRYSFRHYNLTWRSEREVEIPIAWDFVKKYRGKRVLEIGNVLSHYYKITHDVVDKYEIAPNVINQDVVDFRPNEKYDLIVSISTLEHVGWDETPKEPYKFVKAVENLKNCLAKAGKIVFTVPLGQNEVLTRFVNQKPIGFSNFVIMKRISFNRWISCDLPAPDRIGSNNVVLIGIIENETE